MEDSQLSGNINQQPTQKPVILGAGQRISDQDYKAAIADLAYADQLLQDPSPENTDNTAPVSTVTLIKEVANSLLKWTKTGFNAVTEEIYHIRIAACKTCPHFVNPPHDKGLLYKIAGADVHHKSTCNLCGCVIKTKARLPHDTCPDADANKPGFNRWGELVPYK
ncbi:hypothetical protein [Mucilaginibacter sp.]|uniref:hypothetical protein n=1 Tax=Mucilaginibacter sp. TaxID=1882438 RepID=UPI0032639A7A